MSWLQAAADARAAAEPHAITYVDFLTVTLTALCVLLAGLAIFIGVAAIWGFGGIKEEAAKAAAKAAEKKLAEYFEKLEQRDSIREAIPRVREENPDATHDETAK